MVPSKPSYHPPTNGKSFTIAAVISVLVLGGMFAGGAIFIVRSSDQAQERAVARCTSMVEAERRAASSRYAPAAGVARLEAKVDSISESVSSMRTDVVELRRETRAALSRRGGRTR